MSQANIIGPQVRRLRAKEGMTQAELVARCGVLGWHISRGTLAKIESQVRCISDFELFVLAKALRKPIEVLYEGTDKEIGRRLREHD